MPGTGALRAMTPALLIGVAGATLVTTGAGAQILGEWQILQSDSSFDYLVTERGLGPADSVRWGSSTLRVTASRMLVRYIAANRARISAARERLGANTRGYDRFASTTYLLDVDCDRRMVALIESTDFDDDGGVLSRFRPDRSLGRTLENWSGDTVDRLIAWTCRAGGHGR